MKPAEEWLSLWQQKREVLASPVNLNDYFSLPELAGKQLAVIDIGPCSIPSGQVLVRDPLCYLTRNDGLPYFQTAPVGTYRTEVCVIKRDESGDCDRYAAVRLRFSDAEAVRFEEALVGNEQLQGMEEGEFFGFNVDAGLACICDKQVQQAYIDFEQSWRQHNPDKNIYDDYFAALFADSYKQHPQHQRSGGDWINWQIPNSDYHLPFFQSGFGDGAYPVYWGVDATGHICQIVVQFIDIELAYEDEDEAESEDEN